MVKGRAAWLFVVVTAVWLCIFWETRITLAPVVSDSMATLQMGVNLAHHGVLSVDEQAPYEPSMYREPAPAVIAAALVKGVDAAFGKAEQAEYLSGERALWIKRQNLLWFLLLCASTGAAVLWWTRSAVAAFIAAIAAQAFYFYPAIRAYGIDSLFSDIPAAAVLTAVSLLLAKAMGSCSWRHGLAAGLGFGFLTLIKAALLYVFAGLVLAAILFFILRRDRHELRQGLAVVAVMIVGFSALVLPWVARNHSLFDTWSVSDRGGLSLYTRMLKDEMTSGEYKGAFYAWTPGALQGVVGRLTGFTPADLEPGGKLQRFKHAADDTEVYARERAAERAGKPQDAIAWYYQGRAERVRQVQIATAAGHPFPWLAADQAMQREAMTYLKAHPVENLKLALPFMWRGALVIFPALCLGLAFALWRRFDELVWFCLPAFGLVTFYALFANFEERYGIPAMPVAIASGIIVLLRWWQDREIRTK